jgi:hypothetical protein
LPNAELLWQTAVFDHCDRSGYHQCQKRVSSTHILPCVPYADRTIWKWQNYVMPSERERTAAENPAKQNLKFYFFGKSLT